MYSEDFLKVIDRWSVLYFCVHIRIEYVQSRQQLFLLDAQGDVLLNAGNLALDDIEFCSRHHFLDFIVQRVEALHRCIVAELPFKLLELLLACKCLIAQLEHFDVGRQCSNGCIGFLHSLEPLFRKDVFE